MEPIGWPARKPDLQISFLFDSDRLEGTTAQERDKIIAALAQILMQASGLAVEEPDDDEH